MKPFYFVIALCIVAIFAECGHKHDNRAIEEKNRVVEVKTDTVKFTNTQSRLHYSGTIEPLQTIPLSFENVGTVEQVYVREGDFVQKGRILATIDPKDDISLYKAAEAKYNQAKDAYERLKPVYEKGSLPEIKWIETETSLREAEAQMQLSKSSISKCTMRAPTSGVVGKRNIEPGQNSLTLKNPIELMKIETISVKISVAENEICNIKKGQKASFSITALHGKTFQGTVSSVGVAADFMSRTYEVKVMAQNPDLEIKPGMVCDLTLDVRMERKSLAVPVNAVSKDNNGKTYVYVVKPNRSSVKKQVVTLGNYQGRSIEIISGIRAGELIVIEGKEKLSDNSLIRF